MITEYHRPTTLVEALELIARPAPVTFPLGGGTKLCQPDERSFAVVDLQALKINTLAVQGKSLHIGACTTLQALVDNQYSIPSLVEAIKHEATNNLRHARTIAGTIVAANGRSPLLTVLLALDAKLEIHSMKFGREQVSLGDWLPLRGESQRGKLITELIIPVNVKLGYEYVARTQADQPIVCAAVAQWPGGRTRLALGGWGNAPLMAMDGPQADGIEITAMSAYSHASDEWASAEYRCDVAAILARRALNEVTRL